MGSNVSTTCHVNGYASTAVINGCYSFVAECERRSGSFIATEALGFLVVSGAEKCVGGGVEVDGMITSRCRISITSLISSSSSSSSCGG
jgi:hypothetical protein